MQICSHWLHSVYQSYVAPHQQPIPVEGEEIPAANQPPAIHPIWETIRKVAKYGLILCTALVLTSFNPFSANILFVGGVLGLTSEKKSWIRRTALKADEIFRAHPYPCLLATLVFFPSAVITYSFMLGAYAGIELAKEHELALDQILRG